MGVVADVMDELRKLPFWKELAEVPARVEALEKRVAELAAQLEPAPGRRCDGCGHLTLRLYDQRIVGAPNAKYVRQEWRCVDPSCLKKYDALP